MTKQKTAKLDLNGQEATIIDEVVAKLGFKADPEALSRADEKLKEFNRRLQSLARGCNFVVRDNEVAQERRSEC